MSAPTLPSTVALELTFAYTHRFGALAPYFLALLEGRAIASRCRACNATWFPPRMICVCGVRTESVELSGSGSVEAITSGPGIVPLTDITGELTFALVRFDGASNRTLVRCDGTEMMIGDRGRLVAAPKAGPHPATAAVFVRDAEPQIPRGSE